jgi:hypothetical protein
MNTGERRRLIVLLGVAGFLAVVLLAKFVLFSGGGGGSHATATTRLGASATGGGLSTTSTAPASRSTSPPATFDVFATKNPFEPVVIVTPTTGGPGSTTPTTPTTPTTGGTGGTTTSTAAPSNEPSAGTSVALLDVFKQGDGTPMAKVQVASTVYTVGVGSTFATSYRVVSLNAPCGQFLFGDAPFRLCEGEEVIK